MWPLYAGCPRCGSFTRREEVDWECAEATCQACGNTRALTETVPRVADIDRAHPPGGYFLCARCRPDWAAFCWLLAAIALLLTLAPLAVQHTRVALFAAALLLATWQGWPAVAMHFLGRYELRGSADRVDMRLCFGPWLVRERSLTQPVSVHIRQLSWSPRKGEAGLAVERVDAAAASLRFGLYLNHPARAFAVRALRHHIAGE